MTGAEPPRGSLGADELTASRLVPTNNPLITEYYARRNKVKRQKAGLHPLISSEVFNFVDGKRSVWQIYRAVLAESMLAGEFYYGTVSFAGVKSLIDQGVELGAMSCTGQSEGLSSHQLDRDRCCRNLWVRSTGLHVGSR
jgi:hypothetical protein